jgi:hypothetical protein
MLTLSRKARYYDASNPANELSFEFEFQVFFDSDGKITWHVDVYIPELDKTYYRNFKQNQPARSVLILTIRGLQRRFTSKYPYIEVLDYTVNGLLKKDLHISEILDQAVYKEICETCQLTKRESIMLKNLIR